MIPLHSYVIYFTLYAIAVAIPGPGMRQMGGLFYLVKLTGAAYLLYLGYRYWTAPVTEARIAPSKAHQGFLAQMLLTLGNPKGLVFFLALMSSVIDLGKQNGLGYLQLVSVTLILIPSIETVYAALAAQARVFLTGVTARKRMNKSAAAIMIGAGVGVVVN